MSVDYFLRIDGIPGESADAKHKGEIELESFSWGASHPAGSSPGTGGGAAKAQVHDLTVTTGTSKASPKLFLACVSGQHLKSAVLTARRAGKVQQEFLTLTLSDVLVSSYQIGGSEEGVPTDAVSMSFGRVDVEYREQKADGSLGAATKAGWDVKANKKV
jgi:type VI secretion system secreted protein Hcp